jgi:hypothetical protein
MSKHFERPSQQNINSLVGNSINSDNTPKQRIETGSADTLEVLATAKSSSLDSSETLFVGSLI